MAGIYVHIPFCRRKCYYCDFFSVGSRNAPWHDYATALLNEARQRIAETGESAVQTLYIGGGTPSQMPLPILQKVITGIADIIPLSNLREITVEVNPEDVTPALATGLREAGVNRVSMGIQSFIDSELQGVGRRHTSAQALQAYETLRHEFSNISIDLIFGLPSQTLKSWEESVSQALALCPTHISAYSLMWEERSALTKMQQQGRAEECDEELSDKMYLLLTRKLTDAGYEHYEISNYCKEGYRSLHNTSYWTGEAYLGLGPGAHSYDGAKIRRANPCDIARYIKHYADKSAQQAAYYEEELLTAEELREEYIMTRLRLCEGIDLAEFRQKFGEEAARQLRHQALRHRSQINITERRLILYGEGLMRSDAAIVNLL